MKVSKILKVVGVGALLIGATIGLTACGPTELEMKQAAELQAKADQISALEASKLESELALAKQAIETQNVADELASYKLELNEKDKLIEQFNVEIAAEEGYFIDEIELESSVTKTLSDKEIGLFDGEVEFDREDYDVEEYFKLENVQVDINGVDYKENPYIVLNEGSLSYFVNIENTLDLSDISDDEPLKLNFLGEEIKVVDWGTDKVTFAKGESVTLSEGETYSLRGIDVKVIAVLDNAAMIQIGPESKKVRLGDTEKIGGFEVRVSEIAYQNYATGVHLVELDLGDEVEVTVEDGDEYADGSAYEWSVTDHQIGIKLAEAFNDLDEDEEFLPLAVGKSISLPNDYLTLSFEGLDEVEYKKITLEEDVKDGNTYVEVKGAFTSGMEDYDRLYVDATGIYDEDLNLLGTEVEIDGTESTLSTDGVRIYVGDVLVRHDFTNIRVNGISVASNEDSVRSEFGTIVSSPEDSLEDKKVEIRVPEEQVFATLKVK